MLTGDNEATAERIADAAGHRQVIAEVLPGDKAAQVAELQRPAAGSRWSATASTTPPRWRRPTSGIAIGAGTDVAIETADIVLMRSDPLDVPIALRIGRGTLRKMRQNLGWAVGYNAIALPIAAGVFEPAFGLVLRPEIAALSMSGSSLIVAVNALLLKRLRLPAAPGSSRTASDFSNRATRRRALDMTQPPPPPQLCLPTPGRARPRTLPRPTLHSHACDSGAMTASTRTGRRLRWSPAGRLLAVVTLALAVIGMHSMGAGHSDLMVDGAQVMTQHVGHVLAPWRLHGAAGSAGDGLDHLPRRPHRPHATRDPGRAAPTRAAPTRAAPARAPPARGSTSRATALVMT